MPVSDELVLARQPLHRFAFPYGGVTVDGVDDLEREDEEAAVDPAAIALWFLLKGLYAIFVEVQGTEPPRGLNRGQGRELAV